MVIWFQYSVIPEDASGGYVESLRSVTLVGGSSRDTGLTQTSGKTSFCVRFRWFDTSILLTQPRNDDLFKIG